LDFTPLGPGELPSGKATAGSCRPSGDYTYYRAGPGQPELPFVFQQWSIVRNPTFGGGWLNFYQGKRGTGTPAVQGFAACKSAVVRGLDVCVEVAGGGITGDVLHVSWSEGPADLSLELHGAFTREQALHFVETMPH
jgi:hypothetical protein